MEILLIATFFKCMAFDKVCLFVFQVVINDSDQSAEKPTKGHIILNINGELIIASQRDTVTPQRVGCFYRDRITIGFRLRDFILTKEKDSYNHFKGVKEHSTFVL